MLRFRSLIFQFLVWVVVVVVLLVPVPVDMNNHRIRRMDLVDGLVTTFAGAGFAGFKNGSCRSAAFFHPMSICADLITAGGYFIGDTSSIRYCMVKSCRLLQVAASVAFRTAMRLSSMVCVR